MVHLVGQKNAHLFIAIGGLLSAVTSAALLLHLAHIAILDVRGRLQSTSRKRALRFVTSPNGNLLLSLLVADFLAGLGLSISFNWTVGDRAAFPLRQIPAVCTAQAILIQVGETGAALSTFAIAVHTAVMILFARQPSLSVVRVVLALVWALVAFLAIIGPAALQGDLSDPERHQFFCGSMDAFCWISPYHERARLALHLIWILLAALSNVIIYSLLFYKIYWRVRPEHLDGSASATTGSSRARSTTSSLNVDAAARRMLYFPVVYLVIALPLIVYRLGILNGKEWDWKFLSASGTIFSLLGFADVILYCFTRKLIEPPAPVPWLQRTFVFGRSKGSQHSIDTELTSPLPPTPDSRTGLFPTEPFASPSDTLFTLPPIRPNTALSIGVPPQRSEPAHASSPAESIQGLAL